MAQTVDIKIAAVGTQQAAAQTKSLRQQIKELREELVTLDSTTDEYSQKLTQLGNLMHTQSEITEQAKMATQDYGQTLSNLTSIAGGVVGSIASVNGVMNLLGQNSKGADEAVKTMTSLLGIMQGLKAIEDAEKNFKKLWVKVKDTTSSLKANTTSLNANATAAKNDAASMSQATAATKAQGTAANATTKATNLLSTGFRNLGRAVKSFMASNPFTLILMAVTTIYSVVSNMVEKQREATRELERQREEVRKMNLEYAASQNGSTAFTEEEIEEIGKREIDEYKKKFGYYKTSATDPNDSKEKERLKKTYTDWKETLQKIEKAGNKFTENYKKNYEDFINSIKGMQVEYANWLQKEIDRIDTLETSDLKGVPLPMREKTLEDEKAKIAGYREDLSKIYKSVAQDYMSWMDYMNEYGKNASQNEKDQRKKNMDDALAAITAWYELQKKIVENNRNKGLISAEQYYKELSEIEDRYFARYNEWAANYNATLSEIRMAEENHKAVVININKGLNDELRKLIEERQRIKDWETDPSRDISLSDAERERDRALREAERSREDNAATADAEAEYRRMSLDFDAAWFAEKLAMLDNFNRESAQRQREAAIESLKVQRDRKEEEIEWLGRDYDRARENEDEQYAHDLDALRDKYDNELKIQRQFAKDNNLGEEWIKQESQRIEDEYNRKSEEMTVQHLERLRDIEADYIRDMADAETQLAETRMEIRQQEFDLEVELFEQKKELVSGYINAFTAITSSVSSLLSEVQSQYEEGTKQYEQIAETMLVIQTIEGSLAAFVSGVEAPIPAPYNFILGGVLAGLATATGIMAIQNLKSKKLSSSAASAPTINPYETLSYETNSNIEGNIQDSRCYVLEEDITNTQNRVSVAETEASW